MFQAIDFRDRERHEESLLGGNESGD